MNSRLLLANCATHLAGLPAFSSVHVGTCYEIDYLSRFPSTYPAVWLTGQRTARLTDGRGLSGIQRQRMTVDIAARVVIARSVEGVEDAEPALTALCDALTAGIFGWRVAGAETPFVLSSMKDGTPFETVVVADLVFAATVIYQQPTS